MSLDNERMIDGRYEERRELGRGGNAIVVEAFDTHLERLVALKRMNADCALNPEGAERFHNEIVATAQLPHHSHLIKVFDAQHQGTPHAFMTMELLEGGTFRELLREKHCDPDKVLAKDPTELMNYFRRELMVILEICDGLHKVHRKNRRVHCDLKPDNILLRKRAVNGTPHGVLSDWGLSTSLDAEWQERFTVEGTPAYLSPEQANSEKPSLATDVFGMGAIAYTVLSGKSLYEADSPFDALQKAHRNEIRPLEYPVPSEVAAVCMTALSKKRKDRYPNCEIFREEMADLLNRI